MQCSIDQQWKQTKTTSKAFHCWHVGGIFIQIICLCPKALMNCRIILPVLLPLPIRSIQNRLRSINTCEQMSKSDQCQFQQHSQQESIWWSCTVGVRPLPSHFTLHLINDLQPCKVVTLCVESEMNSQQCDRSRVFQGQRSRQASSFLQKESHDFRVPAECYRCTPQQFPFMSFLWKCEFQLPCWQK